MQIKLCGSIQKCISPTDVVTHNQMKLNCHYCLEGSLINFCVQTKVDKSSDMVTAPGELDAGHYGSILLARKLVAVRGAGKTYDGIYYVKRVTHKIKRGQ
jgi:hypothetical protein